MIKTYRKILMPLLLISFLGIAYVLFFNNLNISKGQDVVSTSKELFGYSWNNNFGWLSLNCRNTNYCNVSNYKVLIDDTGLLSGYAWSESVGWVSFNGSDIANCPSGTCEARVTNFTAPFTTTKLLTGWAKILSDNSWIHLSGADYGARLHSDGSISGYAFSENFGWISFEGANYSSNIDGIYNLFPITLSGSGFQQGAIVSLISKNSENLNTEYKCVDQNNNNTFTASTDGNTLTGSCPLYSMGYGEYDIKVTNPDGQVVTLASASSTNTTLFKVAPPISTDLSIVTSATSTGNTGAITITKISSDNSLIGSDVSLMKDGQTIQCFVIHEYDPVNGWIPGKDENGNVLPMQCDLNNASAGYWNLVVSKMENNEEKWRDMTSTSINVSCVPRLWTASWDNSVTYNSIAQVNGINLSQIYGSNDKITDNCGNTIILRGTCTPNWSPSTSCISSFMQTANNCLNKPTRYSATVGIYGASCGSGYKCQTDSFISSTYGTCLVDPTQCTKNFACHNGDWKCGDATDLCGTKYSCGDCSWDENCKNNQCKSAL